MCSFLNTQQSKTKKCISSDTFWSDFTAIDTVVLVKEYHIIFPGSKLSVNVNNPQYEVWKCSTDDASASLDKAEETDSLRTGCVTLINLSHACHSFLEVDVTSVQLGRWTGGDGDQNVAKWPPPQNPSLCNQAVGALWTQKGKQQLWKCILPAIYEPRSKGLGSLTLHLKAVNKKKKEQTQLLVSQKLQNMDEMPSGFNWGKRQIVLFCQCDISLSQLNPVKCALL